MEEGKSVFKILKDKPTGKTPLRRHIRICEDNIRMELKKIVSIQGIGLIQLYVLIIGEP